MPNWKKIIVSGSDAVLNNVTASGAVISGSLHVSGNILPDSDNVFSLGTTDNRFQLNGGTPVTVTGSGVANHLTRFNAATSVETASIFSSDTQTRIVHDNDTNVIFIVSGSNGELFTITDDNSGNLLEVNDTSGITVFEVDAVGNVTASSEISASGFNISNNITASFVTASFTGSLLGTASISDTATTASHVVTASFANRASSASIADSSITASYGLNMTASNLFVEGTASITYLESIYETSSVIYASGSTKFGDDTSDTHEITGSLLVSGNAQFVDILGVANEIVMVGSNNSLTSSTILSLDPANNYIGINQPNPEVTLHMTGDGAQTAQIRMEQYNDSADAPDIRTRKARGTSAAPTAPNAGDFLFRQNIERYNGAGYSTMHSQQFDLSSGDATKGVYQLQTDIGSGLADRMLIDDEGNVRFTSATTSSFFTGSFTGSFLGDIVGTATTASHVVTASHADTAASSSYALTASVALNVPATASHADRATSASIADELSQLATASIADTATTASHVVTASFADQATTASQADSATTASHALTAITASHALNVPDTASHALTAVTSSHTAGTASFANTATTASYTLTGDGVFSGSFSGSFAGDASQLNVNPFPFTGSGEMQGSLTVESFNDYIDDYAESYFAGTAINASGDVTITGSIFSPYINADQFTGSFSGSLSGSFTGSFGGSIDSASHAETASYFSGTVTSASLAETASFYGGSVTSASLAETASFYGGSVTSASFADSSSLAVTASHAITASFATNAGSSAYSETFTNEGALNVSHSLGTKNVGVFLYDSNDYLFQASSIRTADINVVNVVFASTGSGRIVIIP